MGMINYLDSRPIYEQIADRYRTLILSGALAEDERLPSVRSLAMELSTNPNTVQKAYALLERENYIYTVKGRGNFVRGNQELRSRKREELKVQLAELFRQAGEIGVDPKELVMEVIADDQSEQGQ